MQNENDILPSYDDVQVTNEIMSDGQREVENMLKSINEQYFSDYFSLFIENGFDSALSLQTMTDDDLKAIGIKMMGHRRVILQKISQSNNDNVIIEMDNLSAEEK